MGTPVALKRARVGQHKVWDSQKKEKLCCGILLSEQHMGLPLFDGALKFDIQFYFPMPKSNTKVHDKLRGKSHTYRPDIDNLIKFILDVCNDVLIKDDCCVSSINAIKVYSDNPHTKFTISTI